jgi:hypothetical protein
MKQLIKTTLYLLVSIILSLTGCTHNAAKPSTSLVPAVTAISPHIVFESTEYNLGSIGPRTRHECVFNFKNTGKGTLQIKELSRQQGCKNHTFYSGKKTCVPGETGTLEIPYNAGRQLGSISEPIYVTTNDGNSPKVTLTINAVVEDKVYYEPRHIRLSFDKENAGCPDIILSSLDGKPFSIRQFVVSGDSIFAPINPIEKSSNFTLQPTVYIDLLRQKPQGEIRLTLDHPECGTIIIPFEAMPEFKLSPASITIVDAIPQKPVIRKVEVINNYKQPFTIKSAISDNDIVSILEQKPISDGYSFTIKIAPPDVNGPSFDDTVILRTVDGRNIEIKCIGFYDRKLMKR